VAARTLGEGRCLVCRCLFQNVKNPQAFCVWAVVPDGRDAWFALAECQRLKASLGFAPVLRAECQGILNILPKPPADQAAPLSQMVFGRH